MAAQFLAGQGFKESFNLKGGIRAWQGLKAKGPPELGMAFITGKESPTEIITLAYGMEEGLRSFYTEMLSKVGQRDVSELFERLASIETRHKKRLFTLYQSFQTAPADIGEFEALVIHEVMEGGITTEEFLASNRPFLQTVQGVLDMAMSIEAQALDLYLRYSAGSEEHMTEKVLWDLSEEEKTHLAHLGNLIDRMA